MRATLHTVVYSLLAVWSLSHYLEWRCGLTELPYSDSSETVWTPLPLLRVRVWASLSNTVLSSAE